MMRKTDRTVAKIGRSTKKCDIFIAAARSMPSRRLDLSRLRCDLGGWPRPYQPVDDGPVARIEARADDAAAVIGHRTGAHDLLLDGAGLVQGHDNLARLI